MTGNRGPHGDSAAASASDRPGTARGASLSERDQACRCPVPSRKFDADGRAVRPPAGACAIHLVLAELKTRHRSQGTRANPHMPDRQGRFSSSPGWKCAEKGARLPASYRYGGLLALSRKRRSCGFDGMPGPCGVRTPFPLRRRHTASTGSFVTFSRTAVGSFVTFFRNRGGFVRRALPGPGGFVSRGLKPRWVRSARSDRRSLRRRK